MDEKIAGFALVDDFDGEILKKLGNCLYQNNIIPVVLGLKKGRNVVDKDKTMMTEIDLTFARARTQIDALVLADDYSVSQLAGHNLFKKLIQKMVEENQLVVAMGMGPMMLAKVGVAANRKVTGNTEAKRKLKQSGAQVEEEGFLVDDNLITAQSIDQAQLVCSALVRLLQKAA